MYRQHAMGKIKIVQKQMIKEVKCEKSGTIYYTDGNQIKWSKEDLLKSAPSSQNNVFQEDKLN